MTIEKNRKLTRTIARRLGRVGYCSFLTFCEFVRPTTSIAGGGGGGGWVVFNHERASLGAPFLMNSWDYSLVIDFTRHNFCYDFQTHRTYFLPLDLGQGFGSG